jgi:hypothetical protein
MTIALFILVIPAAAQDKFPIGTVIAARGEVRYGSNGPRMQEEDPVFMHTKVFTGDESRALILLIDDTEISLGSNSEFTIDKFVFDPYDAEENKARFGFARGVFQYISGMISDGSEPEVEIETPYGSIGIRGTVVWGGNIGKDYGIYVREGKVVFSTDREMVFLSSGTGIFIDRDTARKGAVNAWPRRKLETAKQKIAFPDQERMVRKIEKEMVRNIAKRHEYRKIMWPYKENPGMDYIPEGETPYSEEFLQLQKSGSDRIREE